MTRVKPLVHHHRLGWAGPPFVLRCGAVNETTRPSERHRTPVVEPMPKAARQALLLWLGIVGCSAVTLPVWGLFYEPPEPVAASSLDQPERRADALDLPSASAPVAGIDYKAVTASIESEPVTPVPDILILGLRGAMAPEGVNTSGIAAGPPIPVPATGLHVQRAALKGRLKVQVNLLDVARDELARMEPLARDGYIARNRLRDTRLKVRDIEARIATLQRDLHRVETALTEPRLTSDRADQN